MAISVAIVEDHNTLRRQWVERFDFFESVYIVFDADSGEACLHKLEALPPANQPAVILMDIELPGMSGIQTTLRIKDRFPAIDILMLTVFEEDEKIFSSIQAGASGYLLKDISTESLVRSIEELHAGGAPHGPKSRPQIDDLCAYPGVTHSQHTQCLSPFQPIQTRTRATRRPHPR